MEKKRIILCLAHMSGNEMKFIEEAFADNWVMPLGPHVDGFEQDLKDFLVKTAPGNVVSESAQADLERKKVVCLSAGTAAIHLALIACGVEPGDEVMVQSFTFSASANPVRYLGATPVFVDSEPYSWNMDPQLLDRAIADRIKKTGRKPKAIIPVYLYGMPAMIDEILEVGKKYDIPVIEDAAEGFGSSYKGRACGTFGRFGVLSFNGNKMITTSGGGALIVPDEDMRKEVMFYATQARESYPYYHHEQIGYNYRMSNISAAIGRGQMTILEDHIAHHRHLHARYRELLSDVEGITLHENPSGIYDSNFWLSTITLEPYLKVRGMDKAYATKVNGTIGGIGGVSHAARDIHTDCEPNANVEALRMALSDENIESRPLWKPMHRQPVFASSPCYVNGVSEDLFHRGLCLPNGPYVTDEDLERIVSIIKDSLE